MNSYVKVMLYILGGVAAILLITLIVVIIINKSEHKIQISTAQGTVSTKEFVSSAQNVFPSNVIFKTTSSDYAISESQSTKSFNIALEAMPLQKSRDEAEADFLSQLGISQSDACKLTVDLGVPISVDSNASGVNYGLSFCPNSIALPTN